jgi:hypothetical protein
MSDGWQRYETSLGSYKRKYRIVCPRVYVEPINNGYLELQMEALYRSLDR